MICMMQPPPTRKYFIQPGWLDNQYVWAIVDIEDRQIVAYFANLCDVETWLDNHGRAR